MKHFFLRLMAYWKLVMLPALTKLGIWGAAAIALLDSSSIPVPMDDAGNGRMDGIADRVGALVGAHDELGLVRHELAGKRTAGALDESGDVGGDRHRIARGDRVEHGESRWIQNAGSRQLRR